MQHNVGGEADKNRQYLLFRMYNNVIFVPVVARAVRRQRVSNVVHDGVKAVEEEGHWRMDVKFSVGR